MCVAGLWCLQTQYGALCQYILINRQKRKGGRKGGRKEGREGSHTKFRTCALSSLVCLSSLAHLSSLSVLSLALSRTLSVFSLSVSSLSHSHSLSSLSLDHLLALFSLSLSRSPCLPARTGRPTTELASDMRPGGRKEGRSVPASSLGSYTGAPGTIT